MNREQIVAIIRSELRRQFEEGDLGWYTEDYDFVAIDGNPDLGLIADAIIKAMEGK